MYTPINLSEYVYNPTAFVAEGTPTVPPKGWLGNLTDFLKSGLDIYNQVTSIKEAQAKEPEKSSITPTVITTTSLAPSTVQPTGTQQPVLPANTIILGAEKSTQGSQAVPATTQNNNWILIIVAIVAIAAVVFIFRRQK